MESSGLKHFARRAALAARLIAVVLLLSLAHGALAQCPVGGLTISPATLPGGTVGVPYPTQTFTASGGMAPYEFSLAMGSGPLPLGLTLLASGTLSGTPTKRGDYPFTIQVTDVNTCTGTQAYDVTISVACQPISLSPASLPAATTATFYSQSITATGGVGPYSFAVTSGSPPPGLTLASSGVLSGSATATGTFDFVVTATDTNGCTGTASYSITVTCSTITVAPASLPGATTGAFYTQTLTGSGGIAPYTFTVSSGSPPAGLTLASNGTLAGTPTALGTSNFTVLATDKNGCTGSQAYSITVSCGTVVLSPAALPGARLGLPYSQTIAGSAGTAPYTFTVTSGSLPPGLTLSSAGSLSGTPSATGLFNFVVGARDANGCTGTRSYSITVGCPTITVSPASLPAGRVGVAYAQTITASGGTGPYTFARTSGVLPAGLTLSSSGSLSGTPSAAGTSTFFVTATDHNSCSVTVQYALTISAGAPLLTALNPSSAATGGPAFTLQVTGSGFVAGSTILWNGSPRPTVFVSATQLNGSIPAADIAAAGSASVTVVNPGGAASNALQFTISAVCEAPGAPQSPTIVPSDNPTGPVTGIDYLLLSWGPPATGPAPSGYEWALNGDPFTSSATATSVVVGPRGSNDPIQLHVRATGCSPGPAADSPLYSPAPPTAAFSTPGPAAVGAPVTFTDTSDPQATSWLWLFGDGQIATTQSASHAFASAGTYSVVLIASNGAGSSMVIHPQTVQAATSAAERSTLSRTFEPSQSGRQWIRDLRLAGPRRTWLSVDAPGAEGETVVYLRFYDAGGRLVLERRLSVAAGQQALYDVGAFRLRGVWSIEAVSARSVELEVIETEPAEPAKRRDP